MPTTQHVFTFKEKNSRIPNSIFLSEIIIFFLTLEMFEYLKYHKKLYYCIQEFLCKFAWLLRLCQKELYEIRLSPPFFEIQCLKFQFRWQMPLDTDRFRNASLTLLPSRNNVYTTAWPECYGKLLISRKSELFTRGIIPCDRVSARVIHLWSRHCHS